MAHALVLYWLALATRYTPPVSIINVPIRIDFIIRERQATLEPLEATAVQSISNARRRAVMPAERKAPFQQAATEPSSALTLINKDGSLILPEQTREAFLSDIEDRQFDVQKKGLDDMDKRLSRPQALEYRTTVFDKAWQGDRPPLERVLEEAVEKSTVRVKIPIPGRPGAYLRCDMAILVMGGSCGFTANDDGYFVRADDPDTLSPEEDRQCAAWWDLIVSAKTQTLWRKTRALYEQECLKPLAK
ncbi:MAG: hypothetical protein KAZ45_03315 [Arenimonas sp.]|nr:hypothetical protein [Arenimonas sp.]